MDEKGGREPNVEPPPGKQGETKSAKKIQEGLFG